jgi:hypothetical protein
MRGSSKKPSDSSAPNILVGGKSKHSQAFKLLAIGLLCLMVLVIVIISTIVIRDKVGQQPKQANSTSKSTTPLPKQKILPRPVKQPQPQLSPEASQMGHLQ